MKVKTSVTLSEGTLRLIEASASPGQNRSQFIAAAVEAYAAQRHRAQRDARDLETLNRRAAALNEEALDVLSYQVEL